MKKITALMLIAAMILAAAGCGKKAEETAAETAAETQAQSAAETAAEAVKETEPETKQAVQVPQEPVTQLHPVQSDYYECAQREDNTMIYVAEASYLSLNEEEAAAYPELSAAFSEDLGEYTRASIGEFIRLWKESTAERAIDLDGEVPFKQTLYISRMDSRVASILVNTYEYLGGAHGSTLLHSFNYKADSREPVKLSTIVSDNDKLQQVLTEKLVSEYPDTQYFDLKNDLKKYVLDQPASGDSIAYVWTMDYDSIHIYFPEEALASHADGSQAVELKFADYPELLSYDYGAAPENYVTFIEPYVEYSFGNDKVEYESRTDENGIYAELAFKVNGQENISSIFANDVKTWYVVSGEHRFFYVFTKGDDDEDLFSVYRVNGKEVTEECRIEARLASTTSQAEPVGTEYGYSAYASEQKYELPSDPAGLKLDVKETNGNRVEKTVSIVDGSVVIE